MARKRLLQLLLCPGILLQTACDDSSSADSSAEQQFTATEHAPRPAQRPARSYNIPATEEAHATAIQKLAAEPHSGSSYAEQAKALCFAYLSTYGHSAPGRECALECLVQAMQTAPERFSATDFNKAARYCAEAKGCSYEKKAAALNVALQFANYRLSEPERTHLLAETEKTAQQALTEGDKETAAYALGLLVQHSPQERKHIYSARYFQEADYIGSPYRLQMLQLAEDLPPLQRSSILAEELAASPLTAKRATLAANIIRSILQTTGDNADEALAPLMAQQHTLCLLLTERLLQQMNGESEPTQVHATAQQLQELITESSPQHCQLAFARYLCRFGTTETATAQAAEICRNLINNGAGCKEEAQFLLAEALLTPTLRTEESITKAVAIYRELAAAPATHTVQQALQALLSLQQEQKQYTEACATAAELQQFAPQRRNELMQLQAELYEKTGNLTTAINLYAQLKADNAETPALAAPACLKMMQLLCERKLPQRTDKKNSKYYCSDKWYAWQQGREFATLMAQQANSTAISDETRRCMEQINSLTETLERDYDVQIEERDRPR